MMRSIILTLFLLLSANLMAQEFDSLSTAVESGDYGSIKSLLVSQHGELLYEDYFLDTDDNTLHQVFSVTKSIGSALIGIANRQGKIAESDPLDHFFSELYPMNSDLFKAKKSITVAQVLQQRHGVMWDEWTLPYFNPANPVNQAENFGDWYRYFLTRPMELTPGTEFAYSTINSTLMSRMIRVVSGQSTRDFANQQLFGPLGINNAHWELYSNDGLGHGQTVFPNPDGDVPLGYGLWLRTQDMLVFGELYLNGGIHNGQRILDREWIEKTWQLHSNQQNSQVIQDFGIEGYGYQWWIEKITDNRGRQFTMFYANGFARQFIIVIPELGLVIASNAEDYAYTGQGIGTLLREFILPEIEFEFDQRFTGAWYDPTTSGQGFSLEVIDQNRVVGFWYTYGDNGKRWFVLNGTINNNQADLSIIQTEGGRFLQTDPVTESEWGTGRLTIQDCYNMTLEINSDEVVTSIPLTRITGDCDGAIAATD
jgi:CubicO group peptidase (beta-lactamase class C family)